MTIKTLSEALGLKGRISRMTKPELIVYLGEVLDLIAAQASISRLTTVETSEAQAIEQLGELLWKDGQGKNIALKDMTSDHLCSIVGYVSKRVSQLQPNVSGIPWMGLTMRQWQKVLFYYQEKAMPAAKYGYFNKLQADYLAQQAVEFEYGVRRYAKPEDDTSWVW